MKKMFFTLFIFSALVSVLSSCQTEESASVDQDRIRTDYELFYDKNTNKTTATAIFRFGTVTGTPLQLSAPAEVRFNNEGLLFNNVLGRYEKTYDGLVTSGNFFYSDTKGKTFTNQTPVIKTAEFVADPVTLTLNRNQNTTLTWQGEAIGNNEGISVLLLNTVALFTQTSPGASNLLIGGALLQPVNPGAYVAVMDRATLLSLTQQTSAGGSVTTKYRAANKNVQVTN